MAPPPHNLDRYLDGPVKNLVAAPEVSLKDEEKERHRIFALLLMAITSHYWNGLKDGRDYTYPLNPSTGEGDKARFLEDDYHGHNIACLAVDLNGRVIDFEFNHNELFNSSAEHAEARLVRRVFSLSQLTDGEATGTKWELAQLTLKDAALPKKYGTLLNGVSLYTSLESCSQCSGIMALGQVKEVIYLQRDPGMYFIGNILRRLTVGTGLQAPLPISGHDISLSYFDALNEGYEAFRRQQEKEEGLPFKIKSDGKKLWSTSITSYLCTRSAYLIFVKAEAALRSLVLAFPEYRPLKESLVPGEQEEALTNQQAWSRARIFLDYAMNAGRRGTPHRI